VKLKVIENEAN